MKTVRVIMGLSILMLVVLVSSSIGANWYTKIGKDDGTYPWWILRVEVIDKDTNIPIEGANITLYDTPDMSPVFSVEIDRSGVGVALIYEIRYIQSFSKLKVTAPRYYYWETEIMQSDFREIENDRIVFLHGQQDNWSFTNRPSSEELILALKSKQYRLVSQDDIMSGGPALLEFTVELERVHEDKDTYREHRKETVAEKRKDSESYDDQYRPQQTVKNLPDRDVRITADKTYNEAAVRLIILDITLGGTYSYFKGHTDEPNPYEAIKRWDNGVKVTNANRFERKIVKGTWHQTYKGTNIQADGMDVRLTTD